MQLTRFSGPAPRAKAAAADRARTTVSGYINENRQHVIARTGFPSSTFPGQIIYKLRCADCDTTYGSNGCDIHKRRCPHCQQGTKGEPLRDPNPSLFD
jgi:hypothetical protein